jgi:hypothetical protein
MIGPKRSIRKGHRAPITRSIQVVVQMDIGELEIEIPFAVGVVTECRILNVTGHQRAAP